MNWRSRALRFSRLKGDRRNSLRRNAAMLPLVLAAAMLIVVGAAWFALTYIEVQIPSDNPASTD